jgi:hypothetical protein
MFKRKQKTSLSHKSKTSMQKLKRRPTTKIPSPKPEDKFQSKESSPTVTKTESLPSTKPTQLQLHQPLQPRPPMLLHQKRKKLLFKTQKTPTKPKPILLPRSLIPSRSKKSLRTPATLMSLLPRRNTTRKAKTRRTPSELTERSNLMEDSFTIHQLMKSIIQLRKKPKHLLPKKKKRRKLEAKLFHILHPNLTNKRRNP